MKPKSYLPANIRPVNTRRDLNAIADLIEISFGNQMDPDGREYIRHLRRASFDPNYLRWIPGSHERISFPLHGYVWEEDGKIIGNISLIPFIHRGKWIYLIANVAVHPDFRRRGIARQLTQRGLEHIKDHQVSSAWLQVREENTAAYNLYRSLGLEERAKRTTWLSINTPPVNLKLPQGVYIKNRSRKDWAKQAAWLNCIYPENIRWNFPLEIQRFKPGIFQQLYNLLNHDQILNWAAYYNNDLIGVLSWEPTRHYADSLWIAPSPNATDMAITSLLSHARCYFHGLRPLMVNFPGGYNEVPFWEAGFEIHNTLIWMEMPIELNR